jgi:hypothetical protein
MYLKLTALTAIAALLVPLSAQADDWKDESGKGRGKRDRGVTVYVPYPAPTPYYEVPAYYPPAIPKGHMPPPGECREWYPGVPAGQQPPPFKC